MRLDRRPEEERNGFEPALGDTRFRALLAADEWQALSPDVRRRFSKRVANGESVIYAGEVVEVRFSFCGWLLAQAVRLIGGPLPLHADTNVPAVVTVTEDIRAAGQIWTRLYARRRGFPQVIHTSKRFRGPTGLEEYLGYGVGMSLAVRVEEGAIVFRSVDYFLELFGRKLKLPHLLSPGALTISHAEMGAGRFSSTLDLQHPRLGLLIHQRGVFREAAS
jgi:hypothetical protein